MKKILIILIICSLNLSAYNKNINIKVWYDNDPPTANDKSFYIDAKNALVELEKNNIELEDNCQKQNIKVFTLDDARLLYYKFEKELNIPKDFFYDIEKAQLISAVKMYVNVCHLTNGCTDSQVYNFIKTQLINGMYKLADKNRDLNRTNDIKNRNSAILLGFTSAVLVSTVSNIVSAAKESANHTYTETQKISTEEPNSATKSNKSDSSNQGVHEIYNSGNTSSKGYKIQIIKCNNGGSYTAFKENGIWFDGSGSRYSSRLDNLSLQDFAEKKCSGY